MISIINGPNINLQGQREPEIYGTGTFDELQNKMRETFPGVQFQFIQSNTEGQIIDFIQSRALLHPDGGIIINPGAYSHYSYAIADALRSVNVPCVEVHISNIYKREEFRHNSVTGAACVGVISGLGLNGYLLAMRYLIDLLKKD